MRYIKGLDTIRAIAVIFVIIEHWGPNFKTGTVADLVKQLFVQSGDFGVNLFFVLSGFLITGILLNEKTKNADEHKLKTLKNFYIRRGLRIFPIYYLLIIVCYLLNYEFLKANLIYFVTYTSNLLPYWSGQANELSHTWSLAVEEQFYLIWPWLIIFINKKYLKHVFIASIILGIVSRYLTSNIWHHDYPVLVINCFSSFGIGGLYAYLRQSGDNYKKMERLIIPLSFVLLYICWRAGATYGGLPIMIALKRTNDSLFAIVVIMFALNNKSETIRKYFLENRILNEIGKISYGLYLYHYTLGYGIDRFIGNYVATHPDAPPIASNFYTIYAVKLIILFGLSILSFKMIEKPILALKKRFEY